MSIIFGIRKAAQDTVVERELLHLAEATKRFSSDGLSIRTSGRAGMGFQPYHTHSRSTLESAPVVDVHGNLLGFDGRIDNYKDLSRELGLEANSTPDSAIVLASFLRWGEGCFSHLIGDWAIALWSEREQSLYLARDHAGTRTLYFRQHIGVLRWSTCLDTFFTDGATMQLDEDYAACYLGSRPIRDLTPYKGIRAVLPAHYVIVQNDKLSRKPHWDWMVKSTIQYNSEKEYEEHFLTLFEQSVNRRTGPGAPILAQLSGGMDSSSIVSMSDHIRRSQNPSAEIIDTISYVDDSEPSWNERPYFTALEAKRSKVGLHLEASFSQRTFEPHDPSLGVYLLPGADSSTILQERSLHDSAQRKGYRTVLSGIGGDEVLGGVPVSLPELADYLISGRIRHLISRSIAWCLAGREPIIGMLSRTFKHVATLYLMSNTQEQRPPSWMSVEFRQRCRRLAEHDVLRGSRLGLSPTCIDNGLAWWSIMETLPHNFPKLLWRPEYRYPFLDRDLVEYLFSIPREQLLRPGRRRSLMRRSLKHIVPHTIIERRRKAFQLRAPILAMQHSHGKLDRLFAESLIVQSGLVDPENLQAALCVTVTGGDTRWWQPIMKAIALELWLRSSASLIKSLKTPSQSDRGLSA